MPRNPQARRFLDRRARTEEEVRRLRLKDSVTAGVNDLSTYLYVYDPTPGASFHGWSTYDSAGDPIAGFYVTGGRCFLTGMIQWLGGTSDYGARGTNGNLSIIDTALPAYAWPPADVTIELEFDLVGTTWSPAPLGGTDGYYGATIQVIATTDGFLEMPTIFGNSYSGRARRASDSTVYGEGPPDGSVLILEGHSWAVVSSD